nr:hypothetical protein CFP56_67524 [Quercus suber]
MNSTLRLGFVVGIMHTCERNARVDEVESLFNLEYLNSSKQRDKSRNLFLQLRPLRHRRNRIENPSTTDLPGLQIVLIAIKSRRRIELKKGIRIYSIVC